MSKYKIDIPKPCHEKWQEMTPSQKGRFCTNCQKEVIDFTQLSHSEIARKIKNSKNLCGRFTHSQLQHEYAIASQNKLSKLGIVLGLGSIIAIAQPSFAQEKQTEKVSIYQKDVHLQGEIAIANTTKDSIIIKGIVLYENKLPLPGVNIVQKNTQNSTQTDFDGNFSIKISNSDFESSVYLTFTYAGFYEIEKEIEDKSELKLTMKYNRELNNVVPTALGIIKVRKIKRND